VGYAEAKSKSVNMEDDWLEMAYEDQHHNPHISDDEIEDEDEQSTYRVYLDDGPVDSAEE
jgi:hypothetical protein